MGSNSSDASRGCDGRSRRAMATLAKAMAPQNRDATNPATTYFILPL